MRAVARWALADLRTHLGQAGFITLAAGGITAVLLFSVAMLALAADPWQRLFAATRGAQVWLRIEPGADTSALAGLDGVSGVSGPFRTTAVVAAHDGRRTDLTVRASGARPPSVSRPEVVSGRWLDGGRDGIVLEKSVATALDAQPGERLTVVAGRKPVPVRVVGVAQTAEVGYVPSSVPGVAWAPPSLVAAAEAHGGRAGQTVGLRLSDPGQTSYMAQRAVTRVGPDQVLDISTWYNARSQAAGDSQLLGLFIGLFGLGALLAAAVAVTGGVNSRVMAHVHDIAVLRAIGFSPSQVVGMFLTQHLILACLGVAGGAVATELLGADVPGSLGQAMQVWQALPGQPASALGTCAATVFVISLATVLAAVRAVRPPGIPTSPSSPPGRRRTSGLARRALEARTPVALVLAARTLLNRPGRSAVAVLRLALPVLMATTALNCLATLDDIDHDPAQVGLTDQLTVRPGSLSDAAARHALAREPGVDAVYPESALAALEPGQSDSVTLRGVGTLAEPYPFAVAAGRAPKRPGEAVGGQGLLDALNVSVGDWVRLTVGRTPCILHIVGRNIETDNGGRVLSTPFDTLQSQGLTARPQVYGVTARPGVTTARLGGALAHAGRGSFEVRTVVDPVAVKFSPMRGVIVGLVAVLGVVALVELLTTIATAVRDHSVDIRAYRSIGLTPAQLVATMVASPTLVVLLAVVLGVGVGNPLSCTLIDLVARSTGVGAGVAHVLPPTALLALGGISLALALLASLPSALHVERRSEGLNVRAAA